MKEMQFENLNKTPVRTKSWLNINDINLKGYIMPNIRKFSNVNINKADSGIIIERLQNHINYGYNQTFDYGVSEELINQGKNNYNEGYLIRISKNTVAFNPIVVEFNLDSNNNTLVDNIIIVGEENSKANIIIKYKSVDNTEGYHNGICSVFAEKNSQLKVVKVNMLSDKIAHFDSNVSNIKNEGNVDFIAIDLGGQYSITNYHGDLLEANSRTTVNSVYLGWDEKLIDINYVITHKGENSKSNIITKGALKDNAKKTFKGTIDFKRGASGSVGAEDEYCLMLSKEARAKAMPLLLCEEEDVSGEHAASSGKIDEDKLFYLMSRGLSFDESRKLIVQAAFNPIIDKIDEAQIISEIVEEIDRRLING
ncbi:Fe-S cluster assembly protein SufD [Inconstantimicrobium mannanitabidum]|uniref:Fe-S cluster assembly protein SufD n=1 Tax=Inconstantimicrobium mannanitabidum TaxID=1604901 RepID=A0ACB5RDK2_9CLOT|nr:Fe-S cluster assembly protein SufD [Clostridium sp. TW13]GKX66841.1 Fe-S cluster assembly protein SufD [Clostridium sp. TW13]